MAKVNFHKPVTNVTANQQSTGSAISKKPKPSKGKSETSEQHFSYLHDIGMASYESILIQEVIIGTDDRIQITDTDKFPWRVSASLKITAADNSGWVGTGWFISPRTLITAGHCVCIKNNQVAARNGWVKKIEVMPGRNGNKLPYGSMVSTEFWSVDGWANKGMATYDYGAIILPAPFQRDIGHFLFEAHKDNDLKDQTMNVEGYPSDKPGTLWYDSKKISSVDPDKIYYEADTVGGQSGACVYIRKGEDRVAVGIHTYGGASANSGTRITTHVKKNFEDWKRH